MNDQLSAVLSENPQYKEAYYGFLEIHKKNRGGTPEELSEFEKYYARDFLNGIISNSTERTALIKVSGLPFAGHVLRMRILCRA